MIRQGRSFSGNERNCVFLNTRATDRTNERFANISAVSGLDLPDDGRALATVDWDLDGDLDFWISNRNAPRLRFMRNDTPSQNHFVQFRLIGNGVDTNRNAIGARVTVILQAPEQSAETENNSDPTTLIKTLRAGEGFLAQSSSWVHFGLGKSAEIDRVIVRWPNDGSIAEEFGSIKTNSRYELVQGSGRAEIVGGARELAVEPSKLVVPPVKNTQRIPLIYPLPAPQLTYLDFEGGSVEMDLDADQATLINLWSTSCRPCVKELGEFAGRIDELKNAGVRILALSIDGLESDDPKEAARLAKEFAGRLKIPFDTGLATQSLIEQFRQLHNLIIKMEHPLPLPTSFLINRRGKLDVVYKGPVSVDTLLRDAVDKSYTPLELIQRSAAFNGTVIDSDIINSPLMTAANQFKVARELALLGKNDEAFDEYREILEFLPNSGIVYNDMAILLLKKGNATGALEQFNKAVELSPEDADIRINFAQALVSQRKTDQARRQLEQALTFAPDNAEVYFNLGVVNIQMQDFDEAQTKFERAIACNPNHARALFGLGNLLVRKNQLDDAKKYYLRTLRITPYEPTVLTTLGKVLLREGDLKEAASRFRSAIEIQPSYADAHFNLGVVHHRNQQFEEARREFETTLRIDSNHQGARAALQQISRGL